MARQRMTIDEVLDWLLENHPDLHKTAEADRSWLWLCCGESLKGEDKAEVRKSLSDFGFRFAPKGHPMPSGNVGIWAHSCLVPKRFAGGKSQPKQSKPKPMANGNRRIDPFDIQPTVEKVTETVEPAPMDQDLAAGLAFFNS